uniref:uncharacterized protein LOC122595007 n=1 Tax=Erigeron canadensis TaxID=72917 RepID=UPI001CB8AE36|nr:uncharacterized protein LOC122595007 [Erigeron canadensis]
MKQLNSITISLYSHRLLRRKPAPRFIGITHFSTTSSSSTPQDSSYHRRNQDEMRNVRVSVWWDFENCQVPCNVNVFKVTQYITSAVRNVGIKGPLHITAFGDVVQLSRSNQEALSSTGINLTHIPNGGKNSADRSLLVDLMYWVSQNPPPAHLFLISGDRDFASTLHRLRMSNYNILLASPDNAPAVLCSAASIMWQWTSLVKGENLNGKYFNQPPDGPYASWYGHYRVALEDPFVVCNQVSNQTPSVQSEGISDSNSDIKPRAIPKVVLSAIRNVLNSYPKGLSITELRAELMNNNVTIEKDFYGHKKFSQFLLAMPSLLRLQSMKDGQHMIHGISPKSRESCLPTLDKASVTCASTTDKASVTSVPSPGNASGTCLLTLDKTSVPNETTKDTQDSAPVATLNEAGDHNAYVPPMESMSSQPSNLNEAKLSRESQKLPGKHEEPLQVQGQPHIIEKTEVDDGQLIRLKTNGPIPKVETFKSTLRRWLWGENAYQENISHTDTDFSTSQKSTDKVNLNGNSMKSKEQLPDPGKVSLSLLSTNEVRDAEIDRASAENVDKVQKPLGIFGQIFRWFKFKRTDKNSDDLNTELSKSDKGLSSYSEMQEILTESFWNNLLNFLETSKGSSSVLNSKTRHEMVQNFQQFGPSQLRSLSVSHALHLVDLLISEKKWLVETPSQTFPFRPSSKISISKRSDSKPQGVKGQIGGSMLPITSKVAPKNRSQILNHCQKLVNQVVKENPDGFKISSFKKLFLEKYGYNLEVQQLGYPKLASLIQIMPGVKLESNCIFPSGEHSRNLRSDNDNDTLWEELGPVAQMESIKEDDFETVSDNDLSDSEDENSPTRFQMHSSRKEQESSLLQILDTWYGKNQDSDNKITSYESAEKIDFLNNNKYEQKQKHAKSYSFVKEKSGDDQNGVINGILGSLKKSEYDSPRSKIEG